MNELQTTETPTKQAKVRLPTKKVRHAIDALLSGRAKNQVQAAAIANLSRERLCRALKEDHVMGYLALATKRLLATSQAPAAAKMLQLLTDARSEHVQKDVAVKLLQINGFAANQERGPLVNIAIGYTVDLRGDTNKPGRVINESSVGGVIIDAEDHASATTPRTSRGYDE